MFVRLSSENHVISWKGKIALLLQQMHSEAEADAVHSKKQIDCGEGEQERKKTVVKENRKKTLR